VVLMFFKKRDYRALQSPAWAFGSVGVVLVLQILVSILDSKTHRWFRLEGVGTLQPSEFAKPALLIFLAWFVTSKQDTINSKRTMMAVCLPLAVLAATVGFGARNFSDLDRGLAEMTRVVKPGGRVVVLEITTPRRPPLSTFYSLWFDRIVPVIGRITGEREAYTYLPSSVKRFPGPEGLAAGMERAGLGDIRWILTAGGIIALHVGVKRR